MSELNKLKQKYEDGGKAEKIKGLTKSLKGEASIGPIPRSKAAEFMGDTVAGAIRSARGALSGEVPLVGGTVGEWIFGQAPEALEDWSYGFGPVRLGRTDVAGPAGALYGMKVDDRLLDVAGAAELPYLAGKMGAKGTVAASKRLMDAIKGRAEPELQTLQQKYAGGGRVGRFISAVDKAIDTLKQKKGTGEQILKQIEATPGVKQEELKYRGLTDIKNQPKVTQEEVKAKAAKKPAPIPKRTVLGENVGVPEDYKPKIPEVHQRLLDEYGIEPVVNPDDRTMMGFHHIDTGEIADADLIKQMPPDEMGFPVRPDGTMDPQAAEDYRNLKRAVDLAERQFQVDLAKYQPKFQRYSQPGGENYREVLVTMPEPSETGQFRSSHYDTPDILTHFRVSDRVGPNGEKVLYVDEIQSDWHQKARDVRKNYIKEQLSLAENDIHKKAVEEAAQKLGSTEITDKSLKELERIKSRMRREMKAELEKTTPKEIGYATAEDAAKIKELDAKIARLNNEGPTMEELADYFQPGKIVKGYGGTDKVLSFNPRDGDWSVTVIEVDPRTGEPARNARPRTHSTSPGMEMRQQLLNEKRQYSDKVPDAPFKDTWHELAVKEIMDIAANEGYAKVAFSPGIEQIKRYTNEMRKAIDEIKFVPTPDGGVTISGLKDGSSVFSGNTLDGVFTSGPAQGKTISEVLGSNIAKQIDEQLPSISSGSRVTTEEDIAALANKIMDSDDDYEFLDLAQEYTDTMAIENLRNRGITSRAANFDDLMVEEGDRIQSFAVEKAARELAERRLAMSGGEGLPSPGSIKGEDLAVGGEGMKSFYDKRLPDFIRKYAGKEFGAPSDYMDITMASPKTKKPTEREIREFMHQIGDADDEELMIRTQDLNTRMAREALEEMGIREADDPTHFDDQLWNVMDEFQDRAREQAAREIALERLNYAEPGAKMRAFTVDVTPKMRERITTEGQKLFAVPPAIGAVPAAQELIAPVPAQPATQEQVQEPQDEPQGFQSGGRVGLARAASEKLLRVLHGSPTKVTPDAQRVMDVTTDPGYAIKRGQDKMLGQSGPPMVNKFDIPEGRLLKFEEQYSPEDIALMRRFFNKLPEGQALKGEDIWDLAHGKDVVMEGVAKAGGFAGYQRPNTGAYGKGDWYRIVEPEQLKRGKKKGGLAQAFPKSL